MRPELERLHFIEQYLLHGQLPAGAPDWAVQVLLDGELAADAAVQSQLYEGLRLAGRRQLRQELQGIHHHLYGTPPLPPDRGWLHRLRALLPGRRPAA